MSYLASPWSCCHTCMQDWKSRVELSQSGSGKERMLSSCLPSREVIGGPCMFAYVSALFVSSLCECAWVYACKCVGGRGLGVHITWVSLLTWVFSRLICPSVRACMHACVCVCVCVCVSLPVTPDCAATPSVISATRPSWQTTASTLALPAKHRLLSTPRPFSR